MDEAYTIRRLAIINANCATLAIGCAKPRVFVSPDRAVGTATVLRVTLSADHRAIDGATGAAFLSAFRQWVEPRCTHSLCSGERSMRRLEQKVALVTGGACGLGKGIAQRLASEGAIVAISDIRREVGEATAAECGFTFLEQDVCNEAQWSDIVGEIEKRFERLDILVNNAGILGPMAAVTPENTTLEDWRKIFVVNVEGVFLGCRAAMAAMRRAGSGAIVNLSSMATRLATPHATAYGASKAAVRHLTKSVAQHCAQERLNVRCNSVHPGMIRTPLLDAAMEEIAQGRGVSVDQVVAEHKAAIPLGDFTHAEDVAAAVAFLVSDDARHVTGSELLVDGGIIYCNTYRRGEN